MALESKGRDQVLEVPVESAAELQTLRNFIRRAFRSSAQTTSDATTMETLDTNDNMDLDYHEQLKQHNRGINGAGPQYVKPGAAT
ncbi:hypothetical protein QQS21_005242 [Conoideocrella luteorostrata]|uniref:Uncharacterized protein n=1 Tax=Conoideocrella luteorostrata TaxID=1105319 RepID=A0AAJ0CU22_9HYPO|nr:hypothetical protein QQS21_005242 [Conoideocrella luteorostrata]